MKKSNTKHTCSKCYPYIKKPVLGILAVFVFLFAVLMGIDFYQNSREINPIPMAL